MFESGMINLLLLPINAYVAGISNSGVAIAINLFAVGLNIIVVGGHLMK